MLQNKIFELEADLDIIHTQYEDQAQVSASLTAERDAAVARAAAAADKAKTLGADLEALRARMAAAAQRPNQEAQRRIQQLELMVAERERVIKALKDEREAANSSHREEQRLHKEHVARMEAEKRMLSGDHAKCKDERYALTTAKDALAHKNTALKEKMHALRQQCKDREASVYSVVDRQRTQITKLQALLREKEKSVLELDENFRKLRESWSSKDETLMRMSEVLGQWPGGLPQEHLGALPTPADATRDLEDNAANDAHDSHDVPDEHEFDVDADDFQSEQGSEHNNGGQDQRDADLSHLSHLSHSDGASDSGMSAVDNSMDENMTSAFIIPDLEFQPETDERGHEQGGHAGEDGYGAAVDEELEQELAQVHAASRNAAAKAEAEAKARAATTTPAAPATPATPLTPTKSNIKSNKTTTQQKSVSFQTTTVNVDTAHHTSAPVPALKMSTCKHNRVNCVVCCQQAGHVGENEKVTVAVPRPLVAPTSSSKSVLPDASMDPGSALAYVMKLLDDERHHLWMQIVAMRRSGETEEARNDQQRPRRVLREAEALWNAYVLKVEQLNRLDDVLEGQRVAGQEMTREEIDVTITRILEV